MKELLSSDSFDGFCLENAVVRMEATYEIDGRINSSFRKEYAPEDLYIPWGKIRPRFYDIIKGRQTPESFRLVFQAGDVLKQSVLQTLTDHGYDLPVHAFVLNIFYDREMLKLTAGVSYDGFTLEKEAEKQWDARVLSHLDGLDCGYEDL